MRPSLTATAPFSITRWRASSVITYRALQMASAGSAARRLSANSRKLQKRYIEGFRKQLFQMPGFGFAARIHQRDLDIPAELPQDLPAGAARRSQGVGVGRDRDPPELAHALAQRLEHGDP